MVLFVFSKDYGLTLPSWRPFQSFLVSYFVALLCCKVIFYVSPPLLKYTKLH